MDEMIAKMPTRQQIVFSLVGAVVLVVGMLLVFRPGEQASAGVALADPTAWIEHGIDGELLQVNGATGEVTARVDISEPGDSIRADSHGDGAVVLNQTAGTVSLVDATTLDVTKAISIELSEGATDRQVRLFGHPDPSGNVVIVDDDQILSIDTQTDIVTPIALPEPTRSAAQRLDGTVLTLPPDANAVQALGPRGLTDVISLPDPVDDNPDERSLVEAGGSVWLVDPARLSVSEVSEDDEVRRPVCAKSSITGAVLGGSGDSDPAIIAAYNPISGLLNVSDHQAGACRDVALELRGTSFGAPVVSGRFAYLPNWGSNRIEVIDLDANRSLLSLPFGSGGQPFDLQIKGTLVWANDRLGPFAAVVSEFGLLPVPKISSIVAGAVQVDEAGDGESLTGGDVDGPGLRILGDSGAEVIASRDTGQPGAGDGTGSGTGGVSGLDTFSDTNTPVPEAVGIAVEGPGDQDEGPDLPVLSGQLIANFGVSSATAKIDETLRFTDFSSGVPVSWTWDFGDGTGAQEPNVEKSWSVEGVYTVELVVSNARGDVSSLSTDVTVVPKTALIPPSADFEFDRDTLEEGETVSLESRTIGEADLLEWDFGDGETSRGPIAEHSYEDAGKYTITLTASNPAGATSASTEITVVGGVEPPQAVIAAIPNNVVNGQFVTLLSASLNEPTRLVWDLGDGTRASGTSVRHAWTTPGTYRVRLTVENSEGSDSAFVDVAVARRVDPPISQFTQSATEVLIGESVTFTNLSLNEPTRLVWNFGDDTTASGPTATKSWAKPGRYRVTLRAINDAGANRSGVTITVAEPVDPPIASFIATPQIVAPGSVITFQDTSANSPTSWSWSFGDSAVSSSANPSHNYATEGTYLVRLTVSNEGGTSSAEREITVKPPPSANFRWATDGLSVKFTDTSWDDPQNWSWDFGDGTTSQRRSPTHRFSRGGSYDVTLQVSNEAGISEPRTLTVQVGNPPSADFSCRANGAVLTCDGTESTNAASYRWSSPEATIISTPNRAVTSFSFDSEGRYNITLEVTSEAGETDSLTKRSPRVAQGRAPRISDVRVDDRDGDLVRLEARFDRNPTTWEWSVVGAQLVEGGNTSTPLFRVPTNGKYSGTARAINAFGSDREEFDFTVETFVTEAAFDWELRDSGVVKFYNKSTARPDATYEWRFEGNPDVLDANPAGPRVRYPEDGGEFDVVLIVEDANGDDRLQREIEVPEA